jgi:hypothetical protein
MTSTLEQDQDQHQPAPTTVINNYASGLGEQDAAGWVLKLTPKHNCIKPPIDNQTFVGSIWRCGQCGQNWLVYEQRGKNQGTKNLRRINQDNAASKIKAAKALGDMDDPEETDTGE